MMCWLRSIWKRLRKEFEPSDEVRFSSKAQEERYYDWLWREHGGTKIG
jgi:hypothetical protein